MDTQGDILAKKAIETLCDFRVAKLMVDTIGDTRNEEEDKKSAQSTSSQHKKCITRAYKLVEKEVETLGNNSLRERLKLFKTLSCLTCHHRQSSSHFATHCLGVKQKR